MRKNDEKRGKMQKMRKMLKNAENAETCGNMRKHAENSGKHVENMRSAENQPNLGISERRILTTAARWALGNAEFQKMVDIGHWRTRNLETRACKLFESNAKLEMRFLGGSQGRSEFVFSNTVSKKRFAK